MVKVKDYFDLKYGANLEFSSMEEDSEGIPFVARTEKNNGVVSRVKLIEGITPNPANTISVSCGGSVMASFLQKEHYYSGRDLYYLIPKIKLNERELLFYCLCLKQNAWKYSYGRQANKTLKDLDIPSKQEIPSWVYSLKVNEFKKEAINFKKIELNFLAWKQFKYQSLFDIERGRGARKCDITFVGRTPFITSIDKNNGLVGFVNTRPEHRGNVLTVARNGSVGETFYQEKDFCSTEDVHVFNPKFKMNKYIALFLITLIRKEKYKYSYGRKWGLERMNESIIKLPICNTGNPDWQFMEDYVKSLPYSSNL